PRGQARRIAIDVQQQRRVGGGQQALGVGWIRQCQDVPARLRHPFQGAGDLVLHVGRWRRRQLARQFVRDVAGQGGRAQRVDLFRQPERRDRKSVVEGTVAASSGRRRTAL